MKEVYDRRRQQRDDEHAALHLGLLAVLRALVRIDVTYLRHHPSTPTLASVRATIETLVVEEMQDVGMILASRRAASADLAAWRCAELIVAGHDPDVSLEERTLPNGRDYLAVGVVLDGLVEWY